MKIKFIKEYKAFVGTGGPFRAYSSYHQGEVEDVAGEDAQWLIDNGFAEKVEEQWPVYGDKYWYVNADGITMQATWFNNSFDDCTASIGNVFKTGEPAHQFIDYLKAVEAIRHDEGFMEPTSEIKAAILGYGIFSTSDGAIVTTPLARSVHAGEFYFDTEAHAKASLDKHRDEWRTILNYDWSRE